MPNSEPDRLQWKLPNQWAIKMNLAKIGGSQTNKQTNQQPPPKKNPHNNSERKSHDCHKDTSRDKRGKPAMGKR